MNFLGHCYLCFEHEHLVPGNLGGDFFKGNLDKFHSYPKHIIDGVKLHRFIDDFTDQSEHVKYAAEILKSNGITKVSFIACDMLIDHYLASNWADYSNEPYSTVVNNIYAASEKYKTQMPADFDFFFNRLKTFQWLMDYPREKGIEKVIKQYSQRIGFENNLPESMRIYLANKKTMDNSFKSFLNDIIPAAENFIIEHKLNIY